MVQIIILVVVTLVIIVLFAALAKPDNFKIQRSKLIHAKPEEIFPLVNDFHRWKEWSPWEGVEGDELQRSYSGSSEGVGSVYAWEGKKTGVGSMEIHHSEAPDLIGIKLIFEKPMEAHNSVEFTFLREPDGTLVHWTMRGVNGYMNKLMSLFMNIDKMVGGSFDDGLNKLKAIAERKPRIS